MSDRQTLRVSRRSWHGRLYLYWRDRGGTPPERENLCHYVRTLLFWAPLRWLVQAHPRRVPWLRPVVVLGALLILAGLATSLVLWPGETLKAILIVLSCVAGAALATWGLVWMDQHPQETKAFWRRVGDLLAPLGRVFQSAGRGIAVAWLPLVAVIGVLTAGVVTWAAITYAGFREVLFWFGIVLASGVVLLLLVLGIVLAWDEWLSEPYGDWRHRRRLRHAARELKEEREPTGGKVAWEWVVAKKHRVCPFIEIDG